MALSERGIDTGTSDTRDSQNGPRVLALGDSETPGVPVAVDGRVALGPGKLAGTVTLRTSSVLRLVLPERRGTVDGDLSTDGQVRLRLAVPGDLERLDGEVAFKGPLALSVPLPGSGATLELPATIEGTAGLRTTESGCFFLDAGGNLDAPLALRLPVDQSHGELEANVTLKGDATLRMALPGGHGELQARTVAEGPVALVLALPDGSGRIAAHSSISTPLMLSMVLPDGRAKLAVHDTITSEVALSIGLPRGGRIAASDPIESRLDGVVFLPSGRGQIQAAAPIHTVVHLGAIAIPHTHGTLTADVAVDGAIDATIELPGRGTQARMHCEAALPLAPLVRLLRAELERLVRVEYIDVSPPQLAGAHDILLPLYIAVRKAMVAKFEATAHLRIDPRRQQVELRSVHAHGLNAAGSAASWLYLNPRMFSPLRHTRLFDPSTMLPPEVAVEGLAFKAASRDRIVIEATVAYRSEAS